MNFFGHAMNAATYVVDMKEFGWQAFGGNIRIVGDRVTVTPLDSMRKRIFIAPYGLWLTLDAGTFERILIDRRTNSVKITLSPATEYVKTARLRIDQPGKTKRNFTSPPDLKLERGAYSIPVGPKAAVIELRGRLRQR